VSQKKCRFGILILGIALQWVMAGCSSQLETTILSQKAPPETEVTEVQEEPAAATPEPVVSEAKVSEKDLGTPAVEPPKDLGLPSKEIQVEEPPKPIFRPSAPEIAVATPPTEAPEAAKPSGSPPSIEPTVGGIPAIAFEPELPPQPTMRKGALEEVAMLEPEPVKAPEKGGAVTPIEVEPFREEPGLAPYVFEPELPPDPTFREGRPVEIAKLEPEHEPITEPKPIREAAKEEIIPTSPPEEPEEMETPIEEKPLEVVKMQPSAPAPTPKTLVDVYFDYDRFSLRDVDKNKLNTNAQILVDQLSGQKVVIEGHCDERGTESYNMILGKRRAETVKQFLVDLGVSEENLEVVSYGKERPFCTAHSLECWQENRRGHFVVH
jgi:peptidoglycan-associated lipoprotein